MTAKRKANFAVHSKPSKVELNVVFFHMPNDKPYGVFCQWHASPISIPVASLQFLANNAALAASASMPTNLLEKYRPLITFSCAEQFYMFCKAVYFSDPASCTLVLDTADPKTQKKLGKSVRGFNDHEWSFVKFRVACVGNWYRFTNPANGNMRDILLGTESKELAEAARRDRIWGIGYNAQEAERYRRISRQNLLGKVLMVVRERLGLMMRKEKERAEGGWAEHDWDWDGEMRKRWRKSNSGSWVTRMYMAMQERRVESWKVVLYRDYLVQAVYSSSSTAGHRVVRDHFKQVFNLSNTQVLWLHVHVDNLREHCTSAVKT